MIRLDWKLTLIKQINQSLDSEPSEFNGTNLTNFRSIKFVGKFGLSLLSRDPSFLSEAA